MIRNSQPSNLPFLQKKTKKTKEADGQNDYSGPSNY